MIKNSQQLTPTTQTRMNSPININNYINIYTAKSPQKGPQISLTANHTDSTKKPGSYVNHINHSYDKSPVPHQYRQNHGFGSINGSL